MPLNISTGLEYSHAEVIVTPTPDQTPDDHRACMRISSYITQYHSTAWGNPGQPQRPAPVHRGKQGTYIVVCPRGMEGHLKVILEHLISSRGGRLPEPLTNR